MSVFSCVRVFGALALLAACLTPLANGDDQSPIHMLERPGLFEPLTEPPCSYVSTQDRKGLVDGNDRVVAWIRGAHNGGAVPIRHFLAAPRVINDTYGLFFYDPDGGYVSAFEKDYGYSSHGWRNGVMVVRSSDGTLWSALSGKAFAGPQTGKKLTRIPNLTTSWDYWRMLHPESTAYDLFDGEKYPVAELPKEMSSEARETMGSVDPRLTAKTWVLGVEIGDTFKAYPLDRGVERACYLDTVAGKAIAVFWYAPTQSAVAYSRQLDESKLTFYADGVSPPTAPIMDKETRTRWSIAGRGIDGQLRGRELEWVSSIRCHWYAWSAEHPETDVFEQK